MVTQCWAIFMTGDNRSQPVTTGHFNYKITTRSNKEMSQQHVHYTLLSIQANTNVNTIPFNPPSWQKQDQLQPQKHQPQQDNCTANEGERTVILVSLAKKVVHVCINQNASVSENLWTGHMMLKSCSHERAKRCNVYSPILVWSISLHSQLISLYPLPIRCSAPLLPSALVEKLRSASRGWHFGWHLKTGNVCVMFVKS